MRDLTLCFGNHQLGLRPDLGGCVSFLRSGSFDWLRPLVGDSQRKSSSYPLVPFSNRVRDARFVWEGETIELRRNFEPEPHAIHGHGWEQPWQVIEHGENTATLRYSHEANDWPWSYEAEQRFSLDKDGVEMVLQVVNQSNSPMPSGLGFHPFFNCHGGATIQFTASAIHQADANIPVGRDENAPVLSQLRKGTPLPIGYDDVFEDWNRSAQVNWIAENKSLTLSASIGADYLVFYSPVGRDYFCLEPVSHMTDAINRLSDPAWSNHGLMILQPGEKQKLTIRMDLRL